MKERKNTKKQDEKLNSKVRSTLTRKELLEALSKRPNRVKAIISY